MKFWLRPLFLDNFSFLKLFSNVEIIQKHGKFTLTAYEKPSFSAVYTRFDIFCASTYDLSITQKEVLHMFWLFQNSCSKF